ncbi:MAG TPA: hypothetical protein VF491_20785, partial [Vicinamibacterales bacterium]
MTQPSRVAPFPGSAPESLVFDPNDDEKRSRALSDDTMARAVDVFAAQGAVALRNVFDSAHVDALRHHFL